MKKLEKIIAFSASIGILSTLIAALLDSKVFAIVSLACVVSVFVCLFIIAFKIRKGK